MRKSRLVLFSAFSIFVTFLTFHKTYALERDSIRDIPTEMFIQWPKFHSVKISPDGKHLAIQMVSNGTLGVKFYDIETGLFLLGHQTQNRASDSFIEWIDSENIIIVQNIPPGGNRLITYNLKSHKTNILLSVYNRGRITYIGTTEDAKHVYVSGGEFNESNGEGRWNSVYRIRLSDGKIELWIDNKLEIDYWETDRHAEYWIGYRRERKKSYVYSYNIHSKKTVTIYEQNINRYPDFTPLVVNSKESKLFALTDLDSNAMAIYEYDLNTGKPLRTFYGDPKYDLSTYIFASRDGSHLEGIFYSREKGKSIYFTPELANTGKALEEKFPDDNVNILDYSDDYSKWIFFVFGARNPGQYYLFDKTKREILLVGENIEGLKREDLARVNPINFQSRDGREIHGYITVPNSTINGEDFPLIVLPHGGPWARDKWEYDPYVQFLASRGFAVLQVNFRSSTGYGLEHYLGGIKKYGLTPIHDLIDGVKWALSTFQLDENRICVFGASYGGFATLGAISLEPDIFRCGITMSGFGDLEKLLKDDQDKDFYAFEVAMMGDPELETDVVRNNSPIYNFEKIKAPILIVHGKLDSRVKFHHALQVENKLKEYGKEYETFYMRDEGHSISKRRNRINFLERLYAFLNKNIGREAIGDEH